MKVAFVSPFFGPEAQGGAESECRNTAIHLAKAGLDVEILTTCALDLQRNWNINYHKQETYSEDGLVIRRFKVNFPDLTAFETLNRKIICNEKLSQEEEKQFFALNVNSDNLYRYLAAHSDDYDWVCFIPYLFGTTVYGSLLCPGKVILIPCLHNEGYARLQTINQVFTRSSRIVFHSNTEHDLALQLYGESIADKSLVTGEGINTENFSSDGDRFRSKHGINGPFVLCAGRKDKEKNVHTLIRYFSAYKENSNNDLKLILIGSSALPIPTNMKDNIIDLGYLPIEDKNDAYSAATVLCQPSLNESFSIVMMESWMGQTPCLVPEDCAVTKEHVVRSGGGLYFKNYSDFAGCLDYFLDNPETSRAMGKNGRKYVMDNFTWKRIVDRYVSEVFFLKT